MSRLHDELTRGAPVLERLLADGVPGGSTQASQAPESAHGGSQLCSHGGRGAQGGELGDYGRSARSTRP